MSTRIAYLPLNTYPEPAPDRCILAAFDVAAGLGCDLHVSTFAVDVPAMPSPLGGLVIDIPSLVRTTEEKSLAECHRLRDLVQQHAGGRANVVVTVGYANMGTAQGAAAGEARYFDLSVLPWSSESMATQDLIEAVVFGSGRPAILVPPTATPGPLDHIAVAWDESRVAARALGDALPLLAPGGRVTVLTVTDEKELRAAEVGQTLVAALDRRGIAAGAKDIALDGRPIATALQETAIAAGAGMLVMGGFGHSRLRDFVLGGATKGLLSRLLLPTLLSH